MLHLICGQLHVYPLKTMEYLLGGFMIRILVCVTRQNMRKKCMCEHSHTPKLCYLCPVPCEQLQGMILWRGCSTAVKRLRPCLHAGANDPTSLLSLFHRLHPWKHTLISKTALSQLACSGVVLLEQVIGICINCNPGYR